MSCKTRFAIKLIFRARRPGIFVKFSCDVLLFSSPSVVYLNCEKVKNFHYGPRSLNFILLYTSISYLLSYEVYLLRTKRIVYIADKFFLACSESCKSCLFMLKMPWPPSLRGVLLNDDDSFTTFSRFFFFFFQ